MGKHIVCLSFDFDALSIWIARGMTTPLPLSRGEFGVVGAQRIRKLLNRYGIKATWFIPGHTIESFPDACEAIHADGHEIGNHGWTHRSPLDLTRDEEEAELIRANGSIVALTGGSLRAIAPRSGTRRPTRFPFSSPMGFVTLATAWPTITRHTGRGRATSSPCTCPRNSARRRPSSTFR